MAQYKYKAKSSEGKTVTGVMDADNASVVYSALRQQDLYLLEAIEGGVKSDSVFAQQKVPLKDLALICKQISSMLAAGVTLVRALDILYQQTEKPRIKKILRLVYEDVQKGDMFSEALRKCGDSFPYIMIRMVEAGEATGSLENATARLALQFEGDLKIRSRIISALIYPAVLLAIIFLAVIILLVFVMPTFVSMFDNSGTELPGITQVVMNISDLVVAKWFIIFPVIAGAIFALSMFLRTSKGRRIKDSLLLKLPITRRAITNIAAARFSRTMSNLISSGIPLINSIEITAGVVGNSIIESSLLNIREDIRIGMSLAHSVKKTEVFPPIVHSMIGIGEESSKIDELLESLAEYLDDEVAVSIQRMMTLLEPALIVVMGVVVGTIVVAMMLPIFDVYGTLQ